MNEKYAGISGRIHGDKNESRPAINAAGNVTVSVNTQTILY
jgi:rRNA processing protein Krr1/Pno1